MIKKIMTITVVLGIAFGVFTMGNSANAVTASDWRAGRIIDDSVFTNANDMSVVDIQNFLNGKAPWCDTLGTKTSELGGGTRAQYGASHGNPAPFTCLRDYYEVPKTSPGPNAPLSNYGSSTIPAGAVSAAQIIYNAAQKYNISAKALLIKLATESPGPLTHDEWPFKAQYLYAMGAHCPDSGPNGSANCDSNYSGFSLQMDEAANLLRWYLDNMQESWWRYKKPYQTNSILWNVVERGCGAGDVYIESKATAALYTYTPYQPNSAALNNMYGTGDSCSAYGNRNFWRVWSDWFGPTLEGVSITSPLRVNGASPVGAFTNSSTTVSFDISNTTSSAIDIGGLAVTVRDSAGNNHDYPLRTMVIPARSTVKYSESKQFTKEDTYTFSIVNFQNGYWNNATPVSNNPKSSRSATVQIYTMPTVVDGPKVDLANLHAGQSATLRFKALNNSSQYAMNLGYMGVAMASPSGKNADLPFDTVSSLAPGAAYDYAKTFTPKEQGVYKARVSATRDGGVTWSEGTFPAALSGRSNRLDISVRPSVTLTQGLTLNNTNPRAGDTVTGTFKVKNFSNNSVGVNKRLCYIMRGPNSTNYDLGCLDIGTLTAGQEVTYSGSRVVKDAGQYKAFFSMYDGSWHDNWSFDPETGTEAKTLTYTAKSNPTLTQGLTMTENLHAGDVGTGIFTIRNNAVTPVAVNKSLCYIIRGPNSTNYDLGCQNIGTLLAGQELTYSGSRIFDRPGQYKAFFSMYDGSWHDNWSFDKETGTELTTLAFTVKTNPTLTQGLTISSASPTAGQTVAGSFKVKNVNLSNGITVNKNLCYIVRGPNGLNFDLGCMNIGTLAPGEEKTFTAARSVAVTGQYKAFFSMYDGSWHDNWSFDKETGTEPTSLVFTAQ